MTCPARGGRKLTVDFKANSFFHFTLSNIYLACELSCTTMQSDHVLICFFLHLNSLQYLFVSINRSSYSRFVLFTSLLHSPCYVTDHSLVQ